MSFTAKELEAKIYGSDWEDPKGYGYTDAIDFIYSEGESVEIDGLPTLKHISSGGAEGDGAQKWVVFSVGDQLFRKTGYYSSWGEDEWDGDLEEVKAVQVTRTEYEAI